MENNPMVVLPIFILSTTVVRMQVYPDLSKAVVLEVVVEEGDHAVCALAHAHPLVNEVSHLYSWLIFTLN